MIALGLATGVRADVSFTPLPKLRIDSVLPETISIRKCRLRMFDMLQLVVEIGNIQQ